MNTPIDAVPVPVPVALVVRPEFWVMLWPITGGGWAKIVYNEKQDAEAAAARNPGSVIFYLPGSAAND